MKLHFIFSMLVMTVSSSAFAVLPPLYQSAAEIKAILEDQRVARELGSGATISSITRQDNYYTIVAGPCALDVSVEFLPPRDLRAGPSEFRLNVGRAICLP